jgi:hypothetical protein
MDNIFLVAGLACLIGAVVGGGLKAFGIEVPILKSVSRQILLGCLGLALLFIGRLPQGAHPEAEPQKHAGQAVPLAPTAAKNRRMSVNVNTSPRVVAPGGSTEITVMVTTDDGLAVPQARVKVGAGGGSFKDTGASEVVGATDGQGIFRTVWSTYEASAYTGNMSYLIGVEVWKDGFQDGNGKIQVAVQR